MPQRVSFVVFGAISFAVFVALFAVSGLAGCDAANEVNDAPVVAASPNVDEPRIVAAPEAKQIPKAPDLEDPDRVVAPDPTTALPPVDPTPSTSSTVVVLEPASAAVRADKVVQNVGVEVLGGRLAPTLPIGCALPCWQPIPVWPQGASETVIEVTLHRGPGATTDGATRLGTLRVESVPAASEGAHTEVVIGLGVVDGSIVAHAKVRESGASLPIRVVR